MLKNNFVINDGFRADLVVDAVFDGALEIPTIKRPETLIIPKGMIPFTQRKRTNGYSEFVVFYEHDVRFADVLLETDNYIEELKKFPGIVSPDCSLYRDMPLCLQIANTYMNRAIGCYLQKCGIYVIPNIRWGDERSYTTAVLPEKFAFLGVEKHGIVSIGTYGCIQGKTNAHYFKEGLKAMLDELQPEIVLVYGSMPNKIFGEFMNLTKFIQFPDWISLKKRGI